MRQMIKTVVMLFVLFISVQSISQDFGCNAYFNSTDGFIDLGTNAAYSGNTLTVEARIKADNWKTLLYQGTPLSCGSWGSGECGWDIRAAENGNLSFNFSNGSGWNETLTSNNPMVVDQWYHIAVTYNNGDVVLYIDGVQVASQTFTENIAMPTTGLYIGTAPGATDRDFEGYIDEVRIWDVALDATTIMTWHNQEYNATHPNQTDLVTYIPFTDQSLEDLSLSGNNGTISGEVEVANCSSTCPDVSDIIVLDVTASSAIISWTPEGVETDWNFIISDVMITDFGAASSVVISGSPQNVLSDLDPDTEYYVYVQAVCDASDESSWFGSSFVTEVACPSVTELQVVNLSSESAEISWSPGSSEIEWNIVLSETPVSDFSLETPEIVSSTIYTATGLTPDTDYYFYVQANCGVEDGASTWVEIQFYTGYCIPNPSSTDGDGIINVSFGLVSVVDNTTTGDGSFANYSNLIGEAFAGVNLDVDITYATGYTYNTGIYVDWNNDLDFDDEGELVYTGESSANNPTTLNASFSISDTISLGIYRMRIFGSDYSSPNPCYTGSYGALEDYSLSIIEVPDCLPVSDMLIENVASNTADLVWVPGSSETDWNVIVSETPVTDFESQVSENVTSIPYQLTNLTPSTNYYVYVQADCGSAQSIWSESNFTTTIACPQPTDITIDSLNFEQEFISWNPGGVESEWNVILSETPILDFSLETPVVVSSAIYTASGLVPETDYYLYVQANCGLDNGSSEWVEFYFYHGYCIPNPSSTDGDGIINVTFGQVEIVDNTTTGDGGYANYSSQIGDVAAGTNLDVDITYATGYTYSTGIYVDWNNDLDFDDEGELVYTGVSSANNPTTLNASFNVPATTTLGVYRMRIFGADLAGYDPCYSGTYAALEDYSINVTEAPSCFPVSEIVINDITGITASISWVPGADEVEWNVFVSETEITDLEAETPQVVSSIPFQLTDLTPETEYYVYVQADCGETDGNSTWSESSFITDIACHEVTNLSLTNLTINSATVTWTPQGSENEWNIIVSETPVTDFLSETPITVESSSYDVDDLAYSTSYYVYVQANCGTIYGNSAWAGPIVISDQSGQTCFQSNGNEFSNEFIGSYFEIPSNNSFDLVKNVTIEAWVKTNIASQNQKIIGKTDSGGDSFTSGYMLGIDDGRLYPEVWDQDGGHYDMTDNPELYDTENGTINSNEWTHLAFTFSAGDKFNGYVNGHLVYSIDVPDVLIGTNTYDLILGAAPWDVGFFGLNGYVDDVRIWSSSIDSLTINQWMHKQVTPDHPSYGTLVANYNFESHSDTYCIDASQNGNNGIGTQILWEDAFYPYASYYEAYLNDVEGVWDAYTVNSEAIITVIDSDITAENGIAYGHNGEALSFEAESVLDVDFVMLRNWRFENIESNTFDIAVNLDSISISEYDSLCLIIADDKNFTQNLSYLTLSLSDTSAFYTDLTMNIGETFVAIGAYSESGLDIIPPIIVDVADANTCMEDADSWLAPETTASDETDGDISDQILLTYSINNGVSFDATLEECRDHLAVEANQVIVAYNVSDAAGNSADEVLTTITAEVCVGIEDSNLGLTFEVFPNPNNGVFTLRFQNNRSKEVEIEIVNLLGQIVYKQQCRLNENDSYRMNIDELIAGTYFVRVLANDMVISKPIVVK